MGPQWTVATNRLFCCRYPSSVCLPPPRRHLWTSDRQRRPRRKSWLDFASRALSCGASTICLFSLPVCPSIIPIRGPWDEENQGLSGLISTPYLNLRLHRRWVEPSLTVGCLFGFFFLVVLPCSAMSTCPSFLESCLPVVSEREEPSDTKQTSGSLG